jgi:hypothetical protein
LVVLVEDARGNVATGYDGSVTVGLANDPGAGLIGGTLTVMARDGVATFTGLTLDGVGIGYKLFVTAEGRVAMQTSAVSVTPAAAARLVVISQPPRRVGVNQTFGLSVAVEDRFGNLETGEAGSVTVALAGSPGKGILGGTLTVTLRNGVATFSDLTLDRARRGDVLKANGGPGLTSAKTLPFSVISLLQPSVKKEVLLVHLGPSVEARAPVKRKKSDARG